jgi:peptide/nickel transport system permease protein
MSALRRNPALAAGAILTLAAVVVALVSLWWTPWPPARIAMARRLQGPSAVNWLGTDHFGRDLMSMMMVGLRNSLAIAVSGVALGAAAGIALGLAAVALRGAVEEVTMRAMDFVFAFPAVLAAIIVMAIMGAGSVTTVVAIAVANVAIFARLARAAALDIAARDFVRAARALGCGPARIALVHVLPNLGGILAVHVTVQIAVALLIEAGLSYLGLGIQPPSASLGRMLNDAQTNMGRAPTLAVFPGLALAAIVLGINLLGDGLRDWLDPRTRRERATA